MAGGNNNVGINHVFPMSLVKDWQKERKDTSLTSFGICLDFFLQILDRVLPKASYMKRKVMRFKLSAWLDYWLLAGWLKESQCTQSPTASKLHQAHQTFTTSNNIFLKVYFWTYTFKNILKKIHSVTNGIEAASGPIRLSQL